MKLGTRSFKTLAIVQFYMKQLLVEIWTLSQYVLHFLFSKQIFFHKKKKNTSTLYVEKRLHAHCQCQLF